MTRPTPHLAGDLFGVGLVGAALLAASILPLSTAYSVSEFMGREAALDDPVSQAPLFYATYVATTVLAALVVLVPGAPLVAILVGTQVVNAVLLVPVLVCMLGIARNPDFMGGHVVSRAAATGYLAVIVAVCACIATLVVVGLGVG
jgi:Mn2+/Fe2+ NRAMP family transporter